MTNQFGSVHSDDLIVVGSAYHRVNLCEINQDKVAARNHAMLMESIHGPKPALTNNQE